MSGDFEVLGTSPVSVLHHTEPPGRNCRAVATRPCPEQLPMTTSSFYIKLRHGCREKLHGKQEGRSCSLLHGALTALGLVT